MKKVTSLILALVMCMSLCVSVFAKEVEGDSSASHYEFDVQEEIERAFAGISELPVTEYTNEIQAAFVDAEGSETKIPTYVTIREVSGNARSGEKTYAMTAVARALYPSASDSTHAYNVTAYGTIYWIAGTGNNKQFYKATGGWVCDNGARTTEREVVLGAVSTTGSRVNEGFYNLGDTFEISQSMFPNTRTSLMMETTAVVENKNVLSTRDKGRPYITLYIGTM